MMKKIFIVTVSGLLFLLSAQKNSAAQSYYVDSLLGNDARTGTSPAYAWKTLSKVNSAVFKPGDSILFKRGGLWRGRLWAASGNIKDGYIIYSSYGGGPEPRIFGSIQANKKSEWVSLGKNIWQNKNPAFSQDVGNLIFDDEKSTGIKKWSFKELKKQGDFYYDRGQKSLNLYSTKNPAEFYFDIECALRGNVIDIKGARYVIIENFDLRYGGSHGVAGSGVSNITIQDLKISYMGGSDQNENGKSKIRYGNGIEFFNSSHDTVVRRCRIDNIYDAALTTQGRSQGNVKFNQYFYNNIVSNCEYSFEYFNMTPDRSSFTSNIFVANNTFLYAGGGWAHGQRAKKSGTHFMFGYDNGKLNDFYIINNIAYSASEANIYFNNKSNITSISFDYNLYSSATGLVYVQNWLPRRSRVFFNLQAWQSLYGQDLHSILGRPPAIDKGKFLEFVTDDFGGVKRPLGKAYDIGAYESGI